MKRRRARLASTTTALIAGVVVALLFAADIPLALVTRHGPSGFEVMPFVPWACVGLIVARRRPRNPIGWLLLAVAFAMGLSYDAGFYAVLAFRDGHPGLPLARLAVVLTSTWALLIAVLPLPILFFPDGRLPSRRWRWVLWTYLALSTVGLVAIAAGDAPALYARHVHVDSLGELTRPGKASGSGLGLPGALVFLLYAGLSLSFIGRQILGFRRSVGAHRQQLKWLMSGTVTAIGGLMLVLVLNVGFAFLGVVALPVSIGVGVLRYRLYEIDRLISRTLSYAVLTALLVGIFVGLVALTTNTLALSGRVGVAASTLAAAALFNPLRVRVQRLVDRRFNRARYDAEAIVLGFTARLRDAVELDAIRQDLLDAVNHAVQPTSATVWIRSAGGR